MSETIDIGGRRIPLRRMGAREWIGRVLHEPGTNRRERRAAAAVGRKGSGPSAPAKGLSHPRYPEPDVTIVVREMFQQAEAEVEERRARHLERHLRSRQLTMDWMQVQALHGKIVDMATPEQRIARDAAVSEELRRVEAAEAGEQA